MASVAVCSEHMAFRIGLWVVLQHDGFAGSGEYSNNQLLSLPANDGILFMCADK
ncbi:hypothetical protein ACU60U_25560 [Klebsiella aerogenes]